MSTSKVSFASARPHLRAIAMIGLVYGALLALAHLSPALAPSLGMLAVVVPFSGYPIFPGLTTIGIVSPAVQELAIQFNLESLAALNTPVEDDMKWAEIAGVTPAIFKGKIPIDLTSLDGYEAWAGVRTYKQIEVIALEANVEQWQRGLEWDLRLNPQTGLQELANVYNVGQYAQAMIAHARVMKARLAATIFMQGTPSTNKALVYVGNNIPGAGLPLFSRDAVGGPLRHYANPTSAASRRFDNYFPAVGPFSAATYALTRQNMRMVPSMALSAESLGAKVTDIIGPSIMEEPFRQVALANLYMQVQTVGGTPVAAAPSNIYSQGTTPCNFWIAPQLDGDPYMVAHPTSQMWIAVARNLIGAHAIEMVAPTKEFTPRIQMFGDGTELAFQTRKVHLAGDLDAGAAAGLPHVVARYEEV